MDSNTLNNTTQFLLAHGYLILFIFSCLEGSVVSVAAGILSSLGYFNIFIVLIISILGDYVPDIIYYMVGNHGYNFIKNKFSLNNKKNNLIKKFNLKELAEKHPIKSIIFIKFSPFLGPFGLIALGSFKLNFKKYLKNVLIITLFKSTFFVFLGYLSGGTYLYLISKLKSIEKSVLIVLIIILVLFMLYKFFINKKVEEIPEEN